MSSQSVASSSSTLKKPTLLPEFVSNSVEALNCASRIILKTCQGVERAVDGVDRITTLALGNQARLMESRFTAEA